VLWQIARGDPESQEGGTRGQVRSLRLLYDMRIEGGGKVVVSGSTRPISKEFRPPAAAIGQHARKDLAGVAVDRQVDLPPNPPFGGFRRWPT
jgi:hypothetical protein